MGRHVSLHTSRAAPFPLGIGGPWRASAPRRLARRCAACLCRGKGGRGNGAMLDARPVPLPCGGSRAHFPAGIFSPSVLTGPGCKRRDQPKRSTSRPSSPPGVTLSYAPFGCGRGAKPRGCDVAHWSHRSHPPRPPHPLRRHPRRHPPPSAPAVCRPALPPASGLGERVCPPAPAAYAAGYVLTPASGLGGGWAGACL